MTSPELRALYWLYTTATKFGCRGLRQWAFGKLMESAFKK